MTSVDMDGTLVCQLQGRGTQNLHRFTEIKYCFDFFFVKMLPEGMTQFDIFHTFVENSVNLELLFF